ncbi:MAG: DUF4185 domain-containing protein [Nannocystaceae bacterium]
MPRALPFVVIVAAPLLVACHGGGPEVASAEEIAVVAQNPAIQGRDGGGSARCFGRSVWVYGDTVLNDPDEEGQNWHHNSYSITDDVSAADGIDGFLEPGDSVGAPRHFIPPTASEAEFNAAHRGDPCMEEPCGARWAVWPGTPIWDEEGQRALIFYGLIYAEPGDFNFSGKGTGIAIWTDPDSVAERPVIDADAEHPDLLFGEHEPGWGSGTNIVDGHLYTFGCDSDDDVRDRCRLARAPLDRILERSEWRFFADDGWVEDYREADALFTGAPIMEVSWSDHHQAWLAIYTQPFDSWIVARTAPELWGPWSREEKIYEAPEDDPPYDAMQHPDFAEEGGRIQYITYSRHTTGWFGTEFPLIRVEFK